MCACNAKYSLKFSYKCCSLSAHTSCFNVLNMFHIEFFPLLCTLFFPYFVHCSTAILCFICSIAAFHRIFQLQLGMHIPFIPRNSTTLKYVYSMYIPHGFSYQRTVKAIGRTNFVRETSIDSTKSRNRIPTESTG